MKFEGSSEKISKYFEELENRTVLEYNIAQEARKKGFEPKTHVEINLARNIGERVEGLISAMYPEVKNTGISQRILELEEKFGKGDWRIGFTIGEDCVKEKFVKNDSKIYLVELGVRLGLAYLTQGTVSAPLEGVVGVKEKQRQDGKTYLSLFFAGPIRAAGGTAMSVAVIVADYVRRVAGYDSWDVMDIEIKRIIHELEQYHERVSRLQYVPSEEEMTFILKNLPIEVNGDPTTQRDVMIYKEAGRIETSKIRGGMCLVLGEGLPQKAAKLWGGLQKFYKEYDLEDWKFLKDIKKIGAKKSEDKTKKEESIFDRIKPSDKYLSDTVGGRPIISSPSHPYGFRIRYGRTRVTGSEAFGFNPVTSYVLHEFLAVGTQLKIERPGKGCSVTVCEVLRGPMVKLVDESVIRIDTMEEFKKYKYDISEIVFLGDVLINYGAFREHKSNLVPSPFVEEWWSQLLQKSKENKNELENELIKNSFKKIDYTQAKQISQRHEIPLHPNFVYAYKQLTKQDLTYLIEYFENNIEKSLTEEFILKKDQKIQQIFEDILLPFNVKNNLIFLQKDVKNSLLDTFGFSQLSGFNKIKKIITQKEDIFDILNSTSPFEIKEILGYSMGARMGRPEKAKMRKLKTSPHFLFPVGDQGGRLRSLNSAIEEGFIKSGFSINYCNKCKKSTPMSVCEVCDNVAIKKSLCKECKKYVDEEMHCEQKTLGYEYKVIDVKKLVGAAIRRLGESTQTIDNSHKVPELVKGIRGASSERKVVEAIEKGLLRAKHKIYVNKDGTIRYDLSEMPITHFKPKEIGTSIEKLIKLGYDCDYKGKPLTDENQILELFPQDIILPDNDFYKEANIARDILNTTKFVDDLLEKLYSQKKFYKAQTKKDIVGFLMIALAPHTSAGTVCRLIGFTQTMTVQAHPLLHAACRRDCDGDELGFMMLLDGFINFSHDYLPNMRGTKNMDAPLVLGMSLDMSVIDDEVYNFDVVDNYDLDFYELTQKVPKPNEPKIEVIEDRLGDPKQFEGYGFTHPVENFNEGVHVSNYKLLPTMVDKVEKQMDLAFKVKAIDSSKVASLIIEKHFLRDIKGNLRKFSMQKFRCASCNEKYRRPPLNSVCAKCKGKILLTIHEGSVVKYVEQTINLANKYNVHPYLKQTIRILEERIYQVFGNDRAKQENLKQFFE